MVGLGYLPGDIAFSSGTAVNSDGTVIVGNGYQRISPTIAIMQAFRWTQSFGMVGLGFLPGYAASFAYAVSADGAVVAGTASSDQSSGFPLGSEQAVRWTQSDGLVGLGFLPGGSFSTATGISSDGMVVIGTSTKTAGANEAFRWTQKGGMVALGRLPGRAYSIANAVSADGSVVVGSSSGPGQKAFRWTQSQGMVDVADLLIASGVQVGSWNLQSATAVSADGSVIVGYGAGPAGRIEAWWAKIGVNTGFLTTSVLNQSLQSVGALPQFAAQTATSDLDHALISALQFGRSGFDEPLGGWAAWGSFGRRQFHGGYGPETGPEGAIGFSRRVSQAWRIGVGAHRSKHDLDLPAYEGHADGDVWGVSATAAFEAGDVGPRAYASIMSDWFSTDITRGYLNGIMPDRSRGKRKGKAYGAAAELGWLFPIFRSASLMPFVLHQAVKLELDPYTEATGAFPAAFNGVDHESQITRVGAEVRSPGVHLHQIWASANWAHQHDAKGIDVAGRVIALNSPFSVPGQELRSDWLEAALGASLRLMPGVLVDARVTAAERGAAGADFSAGLGIVARI
ncbi:MAG: autotransporter domain-containing protein [Alphaproteobacteria bacterium]